MQRLTAFLIASALLTGCADVTSVDEASQADPILSSPSFALTAISPETGPLAYVTNAGLSGPNTVTVIGTATNSIIEAVTTGARPFAVAFTPDGAFAYVANSFSNSVSVIKTSNGSVVATVPVGPGPSGVAITPDGAYAYVSNLSSNSVSVIETSNNVVVATIPLIGRPYGIAITPDGGYAYVAIRLGFPTGQGLTVEVIETATNSVVASVPVGINPIGVAITPDGSFVYVTNGTGSLGPVTVIETASNTVVTTLEPSGSPRGVAFTPDGAYAYVAFSSPDKVDVIEVASHTVVETIQTDQFDPSFVATTPDGKFAYVTHWYPESNSVSVIEIATNSIVAVIPAGLQPAGVAIMQLFPVQVDIRRFTKANLVHLSPDGVIDATVLTTESFNAATVDVTSVTLGNDDSDDTPVSTGKYGQPLALFKDIDKDGDLDLLMHFDTAALVANGDLALETTQLYVNGKTLENKRIKGGDLVNVRSVTHP